MAYLGAPALFEDVDQALAGRALGQTAEVGAVALGGSVPSLQNQPQGLLGVRIGNPYAEKGRTARRGFSCFLRATRTVGTDVHPRVTGRIPEVDWLGRDRELGIR